MRNMFTVRTAFIIVSLSIVSAFITGGIVLWFGIVTQKTTKSFLLSYLL